MNAALLSRIESQNPRRGGFALLLGEYPGARAALEARGWRVQAATSAPTFGVEPHSCDLVLGTDVLARDPWDRWALQRMHHALRRGGILALSEPNRLDLSTPGGLAYVAGRAVAEVGRRADRLLRPGARGIPLPTARRPSVSRLRTQLAELRFEEVELLPERSPGWGSLLPPAFAARISLVTTTRSSVAGIDDPWPERSWHVDAYERRQRALLTTRMAWMDQNPRWAPTKPAGFDPGACAGRTVLALAPHPDDEVIGAGGALLALVRAGARVVCVQATDGASSVALAGRPETERRDVRLVEAEAVSRAIGFAALDFWRADNARFRPEPALVTRLAALLERERPALIFVPFVTDAHEDHVTLAVILARALKQLATPLDAQVLSYEVWSLAPPSLVHDVTPLMIELERLLFVYDTAMRVDDFVHYCADRALYHGYTLGGAPAYLESFFALHARDYPDLVSTVRPPHDA